MKLPKIAKKKARIEIIPMIDTMFFLLVFFMIATLSMSLQHGMPVNLPEAESATDKVPEQISITLTDKGNLYLNKDSITLLDLEPQLKNLLQREEDVAVVINADEAVVHGRVIAVMDIVRKIGITDMAIATKPKVS